MVYVLFYVFFSRRRRHTLFALVSWVFFFKQETAYEMHLSLVGSGMCLRDSVLGAGASDQNATTSTNRLASLAQVISGPVPYTPLTPPTNREVYISVVAVTSKEANK